MIVWNLNTDLEIDSYDIDSDALFFQDCEGNPFIAEKDYILMLNQGCRVKSYKVNVNEFDMDNARFSFQYGHRMIGNEHNYIIFRNYINLSFSYMTFVIKENFDHKGYVMQDFIFDIEGYDFVLDR